MKAPIKNKDHVLETLHLRLRVTEIVIRHSIACSEPPEMQANGKQAAEDLREAIRFIEEHAE